MKPFVISVAIEVLAIDYKDAYSIQEQLMDYLMKNHLVDDVCEIDVESLENDDEEV